MTTWLELRSRGKGRQAERCPSAKRVQGDAESGEGGSWRPNRGRWGAVCDPQEYQLILSAGSVGARSVDSVGFYGFRTGMQPSRSSVCRRRSKRSDRGYGVPLLSFRAASRTRSARRLSGDMVLALRLGPRGRDSPHVVRRVDLGPLRPAHLAGPRAGQHEELERQLDDRSRTRGPHRLDRRRHVAMGQRPHVLDDILLRAEDGPIRLRGRRWRRP